MTNGRRKGARGELEVAKMCEQWWQRHEPGCKFRRSPGSGGWGGRQNADVRAHFNMSGDLLTTAVAFPFSVEIKWREDWSFEGFMFGGPSPVWAWWKQARVAAAEQGRSPILFFRNRPLPWLVMVEPSHAVDAGRVNLYGAREDVVVHFGELYVAAYAPPRRGRRPAA